MNESTILVTLTGPSGSGKTELLNRLVDGFGFTDVISHTTRLPRQGEVDGKSYFFVKDELFSDMVKNDEFIEHIEFKGFKYGVSVGELEKARNAGKIPLLIVEPNGLKQINAYSQTHGIKLMKLYIFHETETLVRRYLGRLGPDDMKTPSLKDFHASRISSIFEETNWWKEMPFDNTYKGEGEIASKVAEDIKGWASRREIFKT